MFQGIRERLPLELVKATPWSSGIVALYYRPRTA
jgi:hypothetical protein